MDRMARVHPQDRPATDQEGSIPERDSDTVRDERRARARRHALPPPGAAELVRMLAEFHARGGAVTVCPPAYVLPVQGAGAI